MGHYFENNLITKDDFEQYVIILFDKKFTFTTNAGIFSKKGLDYGSRLLIENLPYKTLEGNILDMGCGNGAIGIVIAKLSNTLAHMVDINFKALELAKINAKLNNVENILIYESNIYEKVNSKFKLIVTNPPIRAGKKIVYEMLEKAVNYLLDDGELWFVIREKQGAKNTIKHLSLIYEMTIITRKKGYFVVKARKIINKF